MREAIDATKIIEGKEVKNFSLYQEDFDINIESLRGKSVLDLGTGRDATFVKYCLKQDIDIIGLDAQNFLKKAKSELTRGHLVRGEIQNPPFVKGKFDLILMRASGPENLSLTEVEDILELLKSGSELKIAPFFLNYPSQIRESLVKALLENQDRIGCKVSIKSGRDPVYKNLKRCTVTIKKL